MSNSRSDSRDLHGNVPDQCDAVLLLIDVINDLDFPQNEYLVAHSSELASHIAELKRRCRAAGIPAIYVNDNKGTWRSDVQTVVREAQRDGVPGKEFAHALSPSPDDYVILKPKHSIFLGTPLDLVLESIGAHTVIMAGVTTNSCVLISAGELFVRGYRLVVPRDCVQALTPDAQEHSLRLMEESYKAETELSGDLDLKTLLQPPSD